MKRLIALGLVLALTPLSAAASVKGNRDPNDVRGPLDIKRIVHGHTNDGKLWHKVVMRSRWSAEDLKGQDEIRFHFSTDREDRYDEVNATVSLKDGKLRAVVFPYTEGSDYAAVGPSTKVNFRRADRYSVTIVFGKKWVDGRNDRYAWSVTTFYKNSDAPGCRSYCADGTERVEHSL